MTSKTSLAALMLSATLMTAPGLAISAYAHDGWDKDSPMSCNHEYLSKEKGELLHAAMKKFYENNKPAFEMLHKLRKERHDILAAKNFDKDAFLTITTQIDEKWAHLKESRATAFASIASKFTPEEREQVSHRLDHHRPRDERHHTGWKQDENHRNWHSHSEQGDDTTPRSHVQNPDAPQ